MHDLGRLLLVLEQKAKTEILVKTLQKSEKNDKMVRNMKELESLFTPTQFNTLMKGIN